MYIAICIVALLCYILLNNKFLGSNKSVGVLTSMALIFTASLDLGLIMLPPITDMTPLGDKLGINPRSLEVSLWTGAVWFMYLISMCYFQFIEKKYNFLSTKISEPIYSLATFLTFAFSIQLFIDTLPAFTDFNPYIIVAITLIEAILLYMYPKVKYICSKAALIMILSLPIIAVIIGADYDTTVIKDLPKAQLIVYQHLEDPDVNWFFLWWVCWMMPIGKYLNDECKPIKMRWMALLIFLVPILLVLPWISIEMSIEFITSHPIFMWYMIFIATIYLSTCIVAMLHNTSSYFDKFIDPRYSTYLSILMVILVTLVIYLIHIPLWFIVTIYGLAVVVGIIHRLISKRVH